MLNIIGVIALVINVITLAVIISQIALSGRFISKKSTLILLPAFLGVYLVYTSGIIFSNESIIDSIILGIQHSVLTFALRFNFDLVSEALASSSIYYIAFYLSIGIAALTSIIVVVAFVLGTVVNKVKTLYILDNPNVVIGYNSDARVFYDSIKSRSKYFIIEPKDEIIKLCLRDNIKYVINGPKAIDKFIKKKNVHFVSFLESDFDEINLIEKLKKYNEKKKYIFDLKVVTNCNNVYAYQVIAANQNNIFIINEESLISKKVMLDYQLCNFMNETHIDYDNAVLRNDTNINVLMIGFGVVNKAIYTSLISNSQYVKLKDDRYQAYFPKYYLFDINDTFSDSTLNHNLHHISDIEDTKAYFPMPDPIEDTTNFKCSIDDVSFYRNIYNSLKNSDSRSIHLLYISLGNELTNIDTALKLSQKLKEWRIKGTVKMFVKVFHQSFDCVKELQNDANIILFGSKEEIYTYPIIIEDFLDEYAKRRALYYELTNNGSNTKLDDILVKLESNDKEINKTKENVWNALGSYQKKSNVSSVLSIFSKLAMLGLNVGTKNEGLTEEEYLKIYDEENLLNQRPIPYHVRDGKNHISKRNALAYMEHLRWNAFMILEGYIPMKKKDISYINNKLYKNDVELRIHACITTYEGLEEYFTFLANLITKSSDIPYDKAFDMVENKKYDYMLMDTVYTDIKLMNRFLIKK